MGPNFIETVSIVESLQNRQDSHVSQILNFRGPIPLIHKLYCGLRRLQNLSPVFGDMIMTSVATQMYTKLECRPIPNVMVALPNIGGAFCSTPQSLADAHY